MDVPVGRGCSGDSLLIRNDGFVKVLLAQNTRFLVCLDGVGAACQLLHGKAYLEAYETESMSISPPMYRDKSPKRQLGDCRTSASLQMCVACSMTGPWTLLLFHQSWRVSIHSIYNRRPTYGLDGELVGDDVLAHGGHADE